MEGGFTVVNHSVTLPKDVSKCQEEDCYRLIVEYQDLEQVKSLVDRQGLLCKAEDLVLLIYEKVIELKNNKTIEYNEHWKIKKKHGIMYCYSQRNKDSQGQILYKTN